MSLPRVRATGLTVVLVLGVAACAPPDTSERGFDSTQVLHVREPTLSLRSFTLGDTGIYLAHGLPDVTVSGGVTPPYDRTRILFTTGAEEPVAPGVLTAQLLPSADGQGRTLVMAHFASDDVVPPNLTGSTLPFMKLTFLDEVTFATLVVEDADSRNVDLGATRSDPILVNRKGADGKGSSWMGLPESLVLVPSGINQIVGRDRVGFVSLTPSSDGTDTQSFSRIPFDGSAPVPIVPGTLAADHPIVTGDGPAVAPSPSTVPTGGVNTSIACPPASPANPTPPCLLFYDRNKPSPPGRTPFVHLLDGGGEMELPGQVAGAFSDVVRVAPTAWDIFWPSIGATATGAGRLNAWHVGQDHAASCDLDGAVTTLSFGVNAWRPVPDGTVSGATTAAQFAVVTQPSSQTSEKRGSWTLMGGTTGSASECHVVARGSNLINQMFYAPDGSQLALLESDSIGVSKIYVTDGDLGPLRVVATGAYFFNIDFHDPRHLLLWHSNTDGYSVSWLDLSTTPAVEHPIADRVRWDARGSWAWINPRWVLLADSDSMQDGSYSLNVVDLETGARKLVSRGVVDFRVPWSKPPPGATTLTVAYVVRSRNPSSQDGLWVAHLPLADFPL